MELAHSRHVPGGGECVVGAGGNPGSACMHAWGKAGAKAAGQRQLGKAAKAAKAAGRVSRGDGWSEDTRIRRRRIMIHGDSTKAGDQ